jgi:F-type H+-transporting ATPase subunit delta
MVKGAVARRYARAIFDIAAERGDLDGWLEDLRLVRDVLGEPQMALFMENPKISFETKRGLIDRSMPKLEQLRRNFLYLLISKRRTEIIGDVCAELEELVNEHRGIAYADVTTAVALNEGEAGLVADRLSRITGKTIRLRQSVDPSIIGGVVARIGDQLIDGSVKGRLLALRQRLVEAAV